MRALAFAALLLIVGCDSQGIDVYTGPADYAYTLETRCFCAPYGPVRVHVLDSEVVDARALGQPDPQLNLPAALTLAELTDLARQAEREADFVSVEYDPTYGFPTDLYIDWDRSVSDEEIGYTATDYTPR